MMFSKVIPVLMMSWGCINMNFETIGMFSSLTTNKLCIKIQYETLGKKTKVGKKGIQLLSDVPGKILQWIYV
jgi:hypothetical protein